MSTKDRFLKLGSNASAIDSLAEDPALLGLWEWIRMAGRPLTLAQIATGCSLTPTAAQRQLDILIAHELIESLPIKGRRRATSYRSVCEGLLIECDMPKDAAAVERIVKGCERKVQSVMATDPADLGPTGANQWRTSFVSLFNLSESDQAELRRRLKNLVEFIHLIGQRQPANGQIPPLSNYGINLQVAPLAQPTLPLPPVRLFDVPGAKHARAATTSAPKPRAPLSSREREVALLLVRGLTRPQVAAELGISAATVATLTKRIHNKLGVHRRAELVSRVREVLGGPTD